MLHPDNGPIAPGLDRTDIDSALNFELDPAYYAAGEATFTAQVWSAGFTSIADEPNTQNNLLTEHVEFQVAEVPTVWLMALDDGSGPGDQVDDVTGLLGFAPVAFDDLIDFLPIASVDFQAYPLPVGPGSEAAVPGLWDVSLDIDLDPTANSRRNEPNIRMNAIATAGGFLDDGLVLGLFDNSVPQGDYSGWAKFGVSWNFASAGTPGHEAAHSAGLNHVNCLGDTDGDGISQEDEGGSIDWDHPTMLPPVCSLAPIDPDGYFGFTNYHSPVVIYSNDPAHPLAAFPFMGYKSPEVDRSRTTGACSSTPSACRATRRRSGCRRRRTSWTSIAIRSRSGRAGCSSTCASGPTCPAASPPTRAACRCRSPTWRGARCSSSPGARPISAVPLEATEWVMVGGRLDDSGGDTGRAVTRTDRGGRVCAVRSTGVRAARARRGDHRRGRRRGAVLPRPSARRRRRHRARRRADRHRARLDAR